ncbi:uncharacterized protein LOC108628772 [Ceratina calcarata]|uniref:Uncharacterized protein LOC108628772 n=1 Tax=Ceratina calcarata TaxID=156304 RepID=A0AAJ7J7Z2_9HYME|nr:uncharacterized protein LOC108628772 [Ceratina calcarata]XP_017886423.1 uncharacterized protein LOC108628772 [Ceratina calcarata]XP_017886424.1 uncharacterized protein LOC108628772 [Ceratina calcarata]XP_017886426.1 uncharacterized protein LOC108628772 [Ceratina calcarata]XP_017886427.1 uncharacterized protein LOC108628772 [Ceratina calcarata]XP_026672551.1 uncharacterized protein LOC108628772 [Ceratina calcarata]XP_026672552.1 uncharacterized protein LOC108628772 [Ceratina calcarata]XP_0
MSLNVRANKWAPKLTIIFQLTIWGVVGIILLQKGAISLCDKTSARNDAINIQEKFTRRNKGESIRESSNTEGYFKIIKLRIETQRVNVVTDSPAATVADDDDDDDDATHKLHDPRRTNNIDVGSFKTIQRRTTTTTTRHEQDVRDVRSIQTPTIYGTNTNEMESNDSTSGPFEFQDSGSVGTVVQLKEPNSFVKDEKNREYESGEKIETKPRRSSVNRVGAVIAIIMLAIGVVMLLLGPLIVIISAISNRRRTRQVLSKARRDNDQPPTYEEAMLMEQVAPRYSTLQLNTVAILDSPL